MRSIMRFQVLANYKVLAKVTQVLIVLFRTTRSQGGFETAQFKEYMEAIGCFGSLSAKYSDFRLVKPVRLRSAHFSKFQ